MTKKRTYQKKPLYRKVNTRARGVAHRFGGDYKDERNSKAEKANEADQVKHSGMAKGVQRGLDYTPLFRFHLKNVGGNWQEVFAEAASRLDTTDPIFWMASKDRDGAPQLMLSGSNSYFHGLFVDNEDVLQIVNPEIGIEDLWPTCSCCTHTLNGKPFTNGFVLEKRSHNYEVYR